MASTGLFGPQAAQIEQAQAQEAPAPEPTPTAQMQFDHMGAPAELVQGRLGEQARRPANYKDFEPQGAALEAMTGVRQRG